MQANDNGPNIEVRALLAIVLSMVVLTLYQFFFTSPPVEQPTPEPGAEQQSTADNGTEAPAPETTGPAVETEARREEPPAAPPAERVQGEGEEEVVVRSERLELVVTNRGGRLLHVRMLDYRDEAGALVDLVSPEARAIDMLPLGLETPGRPSLAAAANDALFRMEVSGGRSEGDVRIAAGEPVVIGMEWADGQGWSVRKEISIPAQGHMLELEAAAGAPDGGTVEVALGPGLNRITTDSRNFYLGEDAVVYGPDGLEKWSADDLEEPWSFEGRVGWIGIESHYFLATFLIEDLARVRFERETVPAAVLPVTPQPEDTGTEGQAEEPEDKQLVRAALTVDEEGRRVSLYLGPKKYDYLSEQGHDLAEVVDFGWFGLLARPLLFSLNWIYGFVGNYGVAIILLTILIRIVFLPLNHKAMVSMRKTQKLQPQMASIRAKYKGVKDLEKRQKMNEEVMELYKREGVSPLGGCLPMLIQIPFLFAFYRLLSVAIELRGAPFALWIQDLSQYDPYLVLPLLMGASMLAQQRMTPTAGANPTQARVMQMMPVIFTVMFLYVPSGLVLYWFTNNLLGIGQQVFINRQMDDDSGGEVQKKGKKGKRGKGKR